MRNDRLCPLVSASCLHNAHSGPLPLTLEACRPSFTTSGLFLSIWSAAELCIVALKFSLPLIDAGMVTCKVILLKLPPASRARFPRSLQEPYPPPIPGQLARCAVAQTQQDRRWWLGTSMAGAWAMGMALQPLAPHAHHDLHE